MVELRAKGKSFEIQRTERFSPNRISSSDPIPHGAINIDINERLESCAVTRLFRSAFNRQMCTYVRYI